MSTQTAPLSQSVQGSATGVIRTGLVAWAAALAGNVAVYGALAAAGVETVLSAPGGAPISVTVVNVVVMTTLAVAIGTGVLAALRSSGTRAPIGLIGLGLGVASALAPLTMQGPWSARLGLAAMHVVAGVAWFVAVGKTSEQSS